VILQSLAVLALVVLYLFLRTYRGKG